MGTSTRHAGRRARALPTRASSGRPKAIVLPEPVGALPQTSRPGEGVGDRGGLDGKGFGDAELVEARAQGGGHAEGGEGGGHGWLSGRTEPKAPGGSLKPQLDTARQRLLAPEHCTETRPRSPPLGSGAMEPVMARKMWRTLEPYHGLIYFAPEATAAYEALGVMGFDGYFASRAAPMGAVPAEVVVATFFNFNPAIVHHAIPAAWEATTPEALLDGAPRRGRRTRCGAPPATSSTIRRCRAPPSWPAPPPTACTAAGRPLYAGHAALPWPDDPVLALWHAITLLREFRGDGHIACLVEAGLDGIDALVFHAASGEVPRAALQGSPPVGRRRVGRVGRRASASGASSTADGAFTDAGAALRQQIEDRTDALALRAVGGARGGGLRRAP